MLRRRQNTYEAHYKEAECMKQALEPLLYKHGVDVIFTGWVPSHPTISQPKSVGHMAQADTVVTPLLLMCDHAAQMHAPEPFLFLLPNG